jgi:hypothetical protein
VVTSRTMRATARWTNACRGASVLLATLFATPAHAQVSDEDKALSLQLFDEGRQLLGAGKIDEACRKLEESRRLDPLPGTLLNVAVCHEQQGRTATAVAEFREAKALAERDHRDDRVALADQHLRSLDGKVSSVVIVVPPEADRPDLSITRDATPVGRTAWGTRLPVDPGPHTIEASATNKKPWKVVLTVGPNGDVQTATLAPLEDGPAPETATPIVVPMPAAPPAPIAPALAPAPPPEHHGLSTRRTIALVAGGVGVVAAGVGTYFGIRAISKHDDPAATCTLQPCTAATTLNGDAKTAADASTLSFGIAIAAIVAGGVLWLTDTSGKGDHAAIHVTPEVAWGRGSIDVGGSF